MPAPLDALTYAKRFVGNLPVDDAAIAVRLLDDASDKLWMAHLWSWTLAYLEPITLVNNQQDYSLATHNDFQALVKAQIFNSTGEPSDLIITGALPSTSLIKGVPKQVSPLLATPDEDPEPPTGLRFFPVPSGYVNVPTVLALYKQVAPDITSGNWSTDFEDILGVRENWFWVYQEIVLAKAYAFTHDQRLGTCQVGSNGVAQYTGQLAVVEAAIAEMWKTEEKVFSTTGTEIGMGQ